jgi:putative Holliday junction resolvase
MAIDVGEKRIGLALSDPSQSLAHPLATITRRQGKRFPMKQLKAYLDEHQPVGIVLGLPLNADGQNTEWTKTVRSTGSLVEEKSGLPIVLWDERMTTARALSAIRDLGGGTKGRKEEIDQLAATVMLQSYIDSRTP